MMLLGAETVGLLVFQAAGSDALISCFALASAERAYRVTPQNNRPPDVSPRGIVSQPRISAPGCWAVPKPSAHEYDSPFEDRQRPVRVGKNGLRPAAANSEALNK